MKILLIIHHSLDRNAGAPGMTWQLGQQYQKLGHEVQYYSLDNLPRKLPGIVKGLIFPEYVATHIFNLARKQAVDVVDASTGDAWVWGKLFRHSKKKPILVTQSHGLEHTLHLEHLEEARRGNLHLSWKYPLYHGGFRLWEVAVSLRCADLVFLLNRHDLKYATKQLDVKPERTHIIPNGIPEAFLNLPFEPMPEIEDSTIRIAQVGSYIPRKGIYYGASALNKILTRYSHVRVSFLGTGVSEEEVYADFDSTVRDRIQVIPHYPHEMLPTLLKGYQIKLFPSLSEGFSLALPEAMACGLAPVATTIPGSIELVRDGYDGILIPARDSEAIEQALEQLIRDRVYLEQLRRNAYATAQNYSWKRIAQERLSLYEKALSQKKYCS
jgi:glycosyltransferase involved in cell wall biosynthesis